MYSHDGLKDSLTNLAAPPLFYEELRRGIARIARSHESLSLIRIILFIDIENRGSGELHVESSYDMEILKFADVLLRLSRGEDLCARLGEKEFIVLLYAHETAANRYVERISKEWKTLRTKLGVNDGLPYLKMSISHVSPYPGQNALELLQNLDCKPLATLGE